MSFRPVFIAIIQTVGIFVAGFVIPMLALFTPVPLIILSLRQGRLQALTALAAAVALIAFLGGWQTAAVLFFTFGLMATGISETMHRRWRPEMAALLGGVLPVVVAGTAALLYFSHIGKNPVAAIEEYLRSGLAEAAEIYTRMGLTETAAMVGSASDRFIHSLVRLIPGIVVTTSVLQAACCYGLSRVILMRRRKPAPALVETSLAQWHAPDSWVWGLIGSLVLITFPSDAARYLGLNFSILFALLYLAQGVAIVEHYLRRVRIHPFIRTLIHTLILVLPSIVFVIALGVVDVWADFRNVREDMQRR